MIIFIGRMGWEEWGTNHLCKARLAHGTAQVVLGLFLTPGFGTCGAELAATPGPLPGVGNAQSVPICPLLLQFLFMVAGIAPIGRERKGKCSVFSALKFNSE